MLISMKRGQSHATLTRGDVILKLLQVSLAVDYNRQEADTAHNIFRD